MSKKNGNGGGTALAPAPAAAAPLATRQAPASRLEGAESSDFVLPRVHLYQGLPSEAKQYGRGFEPGDLINQLTGAKVASASFMPLFGFKQFIRWKEPRGSGLEYSHRDKRQVPAGDLEWNGDAPPMAQEYINWVVLFAGEDTPCILSFTKTSLAAGKTVNTLEVLRTKGNKGPGFYRIEMQDKSNDKGDWKSPRISPAGDPPPELADVATMWFETLSPQAVAAQADEQAEKSPGDFDPDAK
jgi:hypothetical protein